MIDKNIVKYFDYKDESAISHLLKATQYIFSHSRDEPLLDEILQLSGIILSGPMFLKLVEEQLEGLKKESNPILCPKTMSHSLNALQGSVITWLYYALYWAYRLDKEEVFMYPQSLSRIVLLFHKYYLAYRVEEKRNLSKKKEFQSKDFFDDCAQGLIRAFEYMAVMVREDNPYLNEIYFSKKYAEDLGEHFLLMASSDMVESNYFFIMKQASKNGNYLLYENVVEKIRLKVLSSRRIQSGASENTERNQKIVSYFSHDLLQYQKLIKLVFKGARIGSKNGNRKNYNKQYTEKEDFDVVLYSVKNNATESMSCEEGQEAIQKRKRKYRAIPKEEEEIEERIDFIQNNDRQRKINRAFSANVTKRSLKLIADYTIPVKTHLKEFFLIFKEDTICDEFSYDGLFFTVFIISSVTGMGYEKIINTLYEKDKVVTFDLNEKVVFVKLDESLFAKDKKNNYMLKSVKHISYLLPPLIVMLIRKMKQILEISLVEIGNNVQYDILQSKQVYKWYERYLTQRVKIFNKKIVIKPNEMWRVVEAYKKETLKEEMSTLFCVGKYQMLDRSKMAYTSIHNKGQIHAGFIVSLYENLGIHDVLSSVLQKDFSEYTLSIPIDSTVKYAGSSRALDVKNSKQFFLKMKALIIREENSKLRFNLIAIYIKYALSILLGTRTFRYSTALDNVSFLLHILSISEKASTLLAGIRVIPLCERAEQIIKGYKNECDTLKVPFDHVYILNGRKIDLFTRDLAIATLKEVEADEWLQYFVSAVPVNTGRHIATNEARERNFNGYYLEAFLGHYGSGEEQLGLFSTLDMPDYISQCRKLMQSIAQKYGVLKL